MAKHKLVGHRDGVPVTVDGHEVGDEFEISLDRVAQLEAYGYRFERLDEPKDDTKTK